MKTLKRFTLLAVILCLAFCLAGCGEKADAPLYKIGIMQLDRKSTRLNSSHM